MLLISSTKTSCLMRKMSHGGLRGGRPYRGKCWGWPTARAIPEAAGSVTARDRREPESGRTRLYLPARTVGSRALPLGHHLDRLARSRRGFDRASLKSSSKTALHRKTRYREAQNTPIPHPRLASPIALGLALSRALRARLVPLRALLLLCRHHRGRRRRVGPRTVCLQSRKVSGWPKICKLAHAFPWE